MKTFILNILFFAIVSILSFLGVFLLENGRADGYYLKFTTPKKHSLILGNSKGAQGLIPSEMDKILEDHYESDLYNFCFTLYSSPYGPAYLEVVKKKVDPETKNGLFILTVDPWSISALKSDPESVDLFDENNLFLPDMKIVDQNPNFFYLYKHYQKSFYEIINQRLKPGTIKLHEDGWLESEDILNSKVVENWTESKIQFYSEYASERTYSETRLSFLIKTIEFLKSKGDVVLVRLPVSEEIEKIENNFIPNFNSKMAEVAKGNSVYYKDFNLEKDNLFFEDGLHLDSKSSLLLSIRLADWIKYKK